MVKKALIGSSLALIVALGLTACSPETPITSPSQVESVETGEASDAAVLAAYEAAYETGDTETIANLLSSNSFNSDRPATVLIPDGDAPEVNPVKEGGRWYIQAPTVILTTSHFFDSQFTIGDTMLDSESTFTALTGDYTVSFESSTNLFLPETAQIVTTVGTPVDLFKALFPYGNDMPVFTPETEQNIISSYSASAGVPTEGLVFENYTYQEATDTIQVLGQGFNQTNSLSYVDGSWSVIQP